VIQEDVSNLKQFTQTGFDSEVLGAAQPVVVDFYADWCGPCHAMAPVVEQLSSDYSGRVTVGKLDVDSAPDIAMRYGVMGIPTLGLFKGGRMVDRLVGYPGPAGVKGWLERNLPAAA
jgi:thioredoxin 1